MKFWLCICLLISTLVRADDGIYWNAGIFGGYVAQDHMLTVPLQNSFPLGVSAGMAWKDRWHTNLHYQWLKTEQGDGNPATIHSIQVIPSVDVWNFKNHRVGFHMGLGYQIADLQPVDTLRQVEWLMGPDWNWNFFENISLGVNTQYTQTFESGFQPTLSQFSFLVGISYLFANTPRSFVQHLSLDADQDGVEDDQDECPVTPFGIEVSKKGCPIDSDHDSVTDSNDFCTDTRQDTEVDEMGCPITDIGRGILQNIEFENDSARLTMNSKKYLGEIAENMKRFPNLYFIVEGYASSSGIRGTNLSDARAKSIMNILISYGVPSYKMKAVGFGDQYPLTEKSGNISLNDRIEIKWRAAP